MQFIRKNRYTIVLLGILTFAAFLRLYKLAEIPNGFYVDEAEIGYNAYSVSQTGKDEFGKSFPLFIRSFNVYAPPLYVYVTTIPVYFFGLSIFSVRFISALSGAITVFFMYLIFKILFSNRRLGLLGAFLFAVSPWSIFFSRGAFEANLALLLVSISIYLFILAKNRGFFMILSIMFLSLSTYAYHAERLIAYLFLPIMLIVYSLYTNRVPKSAKKAMQLLSKREIVNAILLFFIIQIPTLLVVNTYAFRARAIGIFYGDAIATQGSKILLLPLELSSILAFSREFLANYVSYFSPKNLFFLGDSDLQRSIPELSVLYSWMLIPYIVGLYIFAKNVRKTKEWWIIAGLALISPIPGALAKDPFSSLRTLPLIIPIIFIITLGIRKIVTFFPKQIGLLLILSCFAFSFIVFWRSYFVLFPNERATKWDYGFDRLAEVIIQNPKTHYIIDQSRMNPAYILLAFHMKVPPEELQAASDPTILDDYYNRSDVNTEYSLKNFTTRPINWEEDIYKEQILVGDQYAISGGQANEHKLTKIFQIDDPLHEPVFIGYQTNPKAKCESIKNTNIRCTIH